MTDFGVRHQISHKFLYIKPKAKFMPNGHAKGVIRVRLELLFFAQKFDTCRQSRL
jgi:hypothetical protein